VTQILAFNIAGLAARQDRVNYELRSDINVFFGVNGTGKTSLLKILASAVRDDINLARRVPFEEAYVTLRDSPDGEPFTRYLKASKVESTPPVPPQMIQTFGTQYFFTPPTPQPGWQLVGGGQPPTACQCTYLPTVRIVSDQSPVFIGGEPQPYSEVRLDQLFAQQILQKWQFYSNTLLSAINQQQEAGLAAILGVLFSSKKPSRSKTRVDVHQAYDRTRQFLQRRRITLEASEVSFRRQYEGEERLRAVVHEIELVENAILDAEKPGHNFEQLIREFISTNKELSFSGAAITVNADGALIGVELLSSGEKQLLRILLEALSCGPHVILIDEPELSMHIDWQRRLLLAMRTINPQAQVLAATHAPEIMSLLRDDMTLAL
jgi:energy-coupling factor transporter ATP-binding protein EcfA2